MPERTREFDKLESEAQKRRRILVIARLDGPRYPQKWVPARNFIRAADDYANPINGEGECIDLLEELVSWNLLEEWVPEDLGGKPQTFATRRFKITKKGRALWSHDIDPIPGVADERLSDR
jgi:hypothetical protein